MYRVMVVDDDKLIREDIAAMVDWRRLGFCEPVQCGDGLSALRSLEEAPCALVITDISMPGLNGVELIRKAQGLPCPILFVVLSNYDDFGYVKEAMRLGAVEYLLKYQLEAEGLTKLLRTVARQLDDMGQQQRRQKRMAALQTSQMGEMVDYFWKDIYFGRSDLQQMTSRADTLGISPAGGTWIPLMLTLPQGAAAQCAQELSGLFAPDGGQPYVCAKAYFACVEQNKVLAILCFEENSFLILTKYLADAMRLMHERLSVCGIQSFIRAGRLCMRFEELPGALGEIKDSVALIFYLGYNKQVANPVFKLAPSQTFAQVSLRELTAQAGFFSQQDLQKAVHRFFVSLREQPVDPVLVKQRCRAALCAAANQEDWMNEGCAELDRLQTLEEYSRAFGQLLLSLHRRRTLIPGHVRPEIRRAAEYIYQHYNQDLSLNQLAEVSELSRNYFSRIFKEETGFNYTDFLNIVRLEHAKRLLQREQLRTNEVARQVGFEDYRYFCRVFKSIVGATCTEYRKGFRPEVTE